MDTLESLSRKQLYEAVWSTPMTVLSKRFGLSDVGLAKLCRRHQIPRPGRGYWAKLKNGIQCPKPPLPPVSDPRLEVISLVELPPEAEEAEPRFAEDDEINALILTEMKRPPVAVAKSLRNPHPLVAAAAADDDVRAAEAKAAQGPRGWSGVRLAERESVARADIEVSRALQPRAYRMMDAVLRAAEERGYEVWGKPDPRRRTTYIKVLGATMELRLYEPNRQKPHVLTKAELATKEKYGSTYAPRHEYVPSGRLCLQLREGAYSVIWQARDGQQARVEDRINKLFFAALGRADESLKQRRKWEQEAAARRAAEQRRQAEEEQRRLAEEARQKEQARVESLLDEVTNWRCSRDLRAYLRHVRRLIAEQGRTIQPGSPMDKQLRWAEGVADDLDPLVPVRTSLPERDS